ncbi:choice-of-anchor H family protein [Thalassotalea marina]|uniref:GlyGly-CTERM sorting domain-containing protein n=1 Tax=Thalassotalea marina TaxID=1673741 RepID=A0A919BPK2_9GAMM|nr:choice-of-anchor H family protein [Thalassotalea marina]GHG01230.1 GlyGly-CTERM sorting domain-containing protein [Thalassotalea marina]
MNNTISTITLALALTSATQLAYATEGTEKNYSVSSVKQSWDKSKALTQLKESKSLSDSPNVLIGKTREQVKALKKQLYSNDFASKSSTKQAQSAQSFDHSFSIYDGYASLIEDIDQDGYFQTFSVTFDADVINYQFNEHARVYAELYLSKDGGDWIHYYTTENFSIYGESEDDAFEVYTTLNQGYVPANYDVLIDLYEVGYSDIVASYSADDNSDLYALPLESSDYDPTYQEVYVSESHSHGGSVYWLLSLLAITPWIRKRIKK